MVTARPPGRHRVICGKRELRGCGGNKFQVLEDPLFLAANQCYGGDVEAALPSTLLSILHHSMRRSGLLFALMRVFP
jgi:hypothetical protein